MNIPWIHFATGGIVPGTDYGDDSIPALLRPGERVLTRQQQQSGGTTNNFSIVVHAKDAASFTSAPTQYQIKKMLREAVQHNALTG